MCRQEKEGEVAMVDTIYRLDVPVPLALLGDMHGKPYQMVVNSLRSHHPEIIAIAGDILYGGHPADDRSPLVAQPYALPFLENCSAVAPTFLSLGNHEWMLDAEDLRQIAATGVTILDNSWVEWNGLVIGGLTSAYAIEYRRNRESLPQTGIRYPKKLSNGSGSIPVPDVSWLQEFCAVPGYHILLSHHPEYYPLIPETVPLILSAHAHGGQWRFLGRGVFAPGQGWWPKWTKGVYNDQLVVTAGLSNTASPIPRLFNPMEVVYIFPKAR